MTVTVTEENGRHRAAVPYDGDELPCCEAGHPDAEQAAGHARALTRALARKTERLAPRMSVPAETIEAMPPRSPRSVAAEAAFRASLARAGAELLQPYTRSLDPHRVRCAAGHECHPRPSTVAYGIGICSTCAGRNSAAKEPEFLARLRDLGATPLYETWRGTNKPHHVRCSAGHESRPHPWTVLGGAGICRICAGSDKATAEAAFRARLTQLGAVPMFADYLGRNRPHAVRCSAGHDCRPRPSDVMRGHDVCRKCSHREWDAFYVVASPEGVKFGVTSGDPRRRLNDHAAKGYAEVVRLVTDLPGMVAHDTEIAIRAALETAGERPVRGREYFARPCLALVLDVADNWLDADAGLDIDGAAWRAECRKQARARRVPAGVKTCESCGEEFAALTARARYCSRRCINRVTDRRRRERVRVAVRVAAALPVKPHAHPRRRPREARPMEVSPAARPMEVSSDGQAETGQEMLRDAFDGRSAVRGLRDEWGAGVPRSRRAGRAGEGKFGTEGRREAGGAAAVPLRHHTVQRSPGSAPAARRARAGDGAGARRQGQRA